MDLIALFAPMARVHEPVHADHGGHRMPATECNRRQRGSDFIAPTMLADNGHVACSTLHEAWIRLRVHQSGGPAPSKMLMPEV